MSEGQQFNDMPTIEELESEIESLGLMYEQLNIRNERLEQENAELKESWQGIRNVLEDTQKEVARLERIIAESQTQKPVQCAVCGNNELFVYAEAMLNASKEGL